ncbi:MAG: TolC family protein [Candidatus Pseudobacter hemicellulosilyticus]|uniref:TolC family protein n=1 Tax=Candidatus Pseudobacter hemicellulosilyticus TaxID=3121375 RepID=A0AAJ6BEK2_9BACT|nr:MAG: TolC family protein [Pseudobacter sp.]
MRLLLLFIATLFFGQLSAQEILRLEDAVAAALQNNYDIRLSRNDSAAYSLDASYAYAGFLPRLNATGTKVWNVNAQKQELQDGRKPEATGIKSSNLTASLQLNWTLFDGLKMFVTRERLLELEKLGDLGVKNQVTNTVATVVNNYYNIVRTKQQLKAVEEQISINEERVKLADMKVSVGLGSKPELLQARVDLNAQKAARLQQLTLIAQLRDQLNQLIGFRMGLVYEVADSIPVNTVLQYGDLEQNLEASSPNLLFARKNIDIAQLTVKERRAELLPIVAFNSAYNYSRTSNTTVINTFTPLFNQNNGYNYGFSVNIPILNNFNTRRLMKQAQLDVRYQQLFYDNQFTLTQVGLTNAFKDYELQKDLLALEEANIGFARENVAIALERFRQGVSTFLELREAQISLEEANSRLIAARYNTKLAETELLRLKGGLLQ